MKEVILHVGLHKTGTTSIQDTLYKRENYEVFKENGIRFIEKLDPNNGFGIYSAFSKHPENFHVNLSKGLSMAEIDEYNSFVKQEIINELNKDDRLLISGEDIIALDYDELDNFRKFVEECTEHEIKWNVIMYLRNPVQFLSSWYQQMVQLGVPVVYKNNFDRDIERYYAIPERVVTIFGKHNVTVYEFEKSLDNRHGLTGKFFERLNIDIDKINYIRVNERLSQEATNIAIFMNDKQPLIIDGKVSENRHRFDVVPLFKIKGSKFSLGKNQLYKNLESMHNDFIWIRDNLGIDYTKEKEKLEDIEASAYSVDEISVLESYMQCTDFVKESMLEYYAEKNPRLQEYLIKVQQIDFEFKNHLRKKDNDFSELNDRFDDYKNLTNESISVNNLDRLFIRIKNFDLKNAKIEEFNRSFGEIQHLMHDLYQVKYNSDFEPADFYRELALSIETTGNINLALKYMKYAKLLRNEGSYINEKIDEYKHKLENYTNNDLMQDSDELERVIEDKKRFVENLECALNEQINNSKELEQLIVEKTKYVNELVRLVDEKAGYTKEEIEFYANLYKTLSSITSFEFFKVLMFMIKGLIKFDAKYYKQEFGHIHWMVQTNPRKHFLSTGYPNKVKVKKD